MEERKGERQHGASGSMGMDLRAEGGVASCSGEPRELTGQLLWAESLSSPQHSWEDPNVLAVICAASLGPHKGPFGS